MLNPNIKYKIRIKLLDLKFRNKYLCYLNEDTSLTEVTDEDILRMCEYSIERYNRYSFMFSKDFLASVLIVCGGSGELLSMALAILDYITLYHSDYTAAISIASFFMAAIGTYVKYNIIPTDKVTKEISDIKDMADHNSVPEDKLID